MLLTAYDRPHYLQPVLESWARARGLGAWHLRIAVEPSPVLDEVVAQLEDFVRVAGVPDVDLQVNPVRLGVAENPYRHLGALFDAGHGFVVRAEDDLVVADDVLELFAYVAAAYAGDSSVVSAHAFSAAGEIGNDAAALRRTPAFCPWVWGTWRDRWDGVVGPTWDRDYSTWNGSPGYESGWDWNLNTRVLPARGLVAVEPLVSRVDNIGVVGVHGTRENAPARPPFGPHREVTDGYHELSS